MSVIDDDILKFIQEIAIKHGVSRAVLFGSRARGDNHETSDYDVAFFGVNDVNAMSGLSEACDMYAPTLKKIDVSFEKDLAENFLHRIAEEGIILYERNKT